MGKFAEFAARHREKAREQADIAIGAVEVVGASGLMGYANHRFGAGEIKLGTAADGTGGVPLDASLFFAGHLLAFYGGKKYASHLHNVANGVGAGFAYRTGADLGDKAATATHTTTSGQLVGGQLVGGQLVGAPQLPAAFGRWGVGMGAHDSFRTVGRR